MKQDRQLVDHYWETIGQWAFHEVSGYSDIYKAVTDILQIFTPLFNPTRVQAEDDYHNKENSLPLSSIQDIEKYREIHPRKNKFDSISIWIFGDTKIKMVEKEITDPWSVVIGGGKSLAGRISLFIELHSPQWFSEDIDGTSLRQFNSLLKKAITQFKPKLVSCNDAVVPEWERFNHLINKKGFDIKAIKNQ